jgi:hypothetical protein
VRVLTGDRPLGCIMSMRSTSAALLALAIAAAGCGGGGDPDEFTGQYAEATAPLAQAFEDIEDLDPESPGTEHAAIAAAFDGVKDRIAALEPPDGAEDEIEALVAAVGDYAEQLRQIGDAITRDDPEALDAAVEALGTVDDDWNDAEEQLFIAVATAED